MVEGLKFRGFVGVAIKGLVSLCKGRSLAFRDKMGRFQFTSGKRMLSD